jgi:hypothetical protein
MVDALEYFGQRLILEKYLDIQVVEDPQQLNSASKAYVRSLFAKRAARDRQIENRGPRSTTYFGKIMPRFNYYIYADQACLDTLLAREKWEREPGGRQGEGRPPVVCAIVDTDSEPEGEGEYGYEPVEGCTRYFPG